MALKLVSDTLAKVNSIQGSEGAETAALVLSVTATIVKVGEEYKDATVLSKVKTVE